MYSSPFLTTSRKLFCAALVGIVVITLGHYMTEVHNVTFHNVYRRLYYVPVVLAAFAYGVKGGGLAAVLASAAYIPHAFFMSHHHQDPAPAADKMFEIALYLAVGMLTGWLVEKERASSRRLEHSLVERRELERELVRAGKLSAMGQLLSGVAHEVRNPLASIMGSAEALERHLAADSRERRLVTIQLREIARLDRVVSKFLAFARTDDPHRVTCALERITSQVVELTRHQASGGTMTIDESVHGATVFADEDQMSQVLLNLTLNAIQAAGTAPYHILFEVRRRVIAGSPHTCLGVRDHGVGVAEGLEEQIFEPYYTTRESGSGLGLALSSRLIEAHGGFIELERGEGRTTFWICIPESFDPREHGELS